MPRLFLLRHAKSSWDGTYRTDLQRPLSARGRDAAPRIGRFMAARGYAPQCILCSSAQRTKETLALVVPMFAHDCDIRLTRELYECSLDTYLAFVRAMDPAVQSLMIIGHNPTTADMAAFVSGTGDPAARRSMMQKFPTAGLAVIDFADEDWRHVGRGAGNLVEFQVPRALDESGNVIDETEVEAPVERVKASPGSGM